MVTRFPVIGSRMVMGSSLSFRHKANAVRPDSIKFASSFGYETVTAPEHSHPQSRSRRYIRALTALEESADL